MEKPEGIRQLAQTIVLVCQYTWPKDREKSIDRAEKLLSSAILSAVEEERRNCADKIEAMADALYEKADAEGVDGRDSAFAGWVTQNIASAIRNRKGA